MKETLLTVFLGKTLDIKTIDWYGNPPEWTDIRATQFPLFPTDTLPLIGKREKYINKSIMGISPLSAEPLLKGVPIIDRPKADCCDSIIKNEKVRIVFADSTGQVDNGLAYKYSSLFSFNFDTRAEELQVENDILRGLMEQIMYNLEGMDETEAKKQIFRLIEYASDVKKKQYSFAESLQYQRGNQ